METLILVTEFCNFNDILKQIRVFNRMSHPLYLRIFSALTFLNRRARNQVLVLIDVLIDFPAFLFAKCGNFHVLLSIYDDLYLRGAS